MDITYLGHSSFRIRGKNATVVTDPYETSLVGLKFPRHTTADIVTISHEHEDHNAVGALEGSPFVIRGPGEYEVKGISVIGVGVFHDDVKGAKRGPNTIYRIEVDGMSIVHLGDLGHMLSETEVDALDGVDILLVPVGGVYTIDAATAAGVVGETDPSVVIPMHYRREGTNEKTFGQLSTVEPFLKEMGKEAIAPLPKLTMTKDKLPEEMQVVVLE